MLSWSLKDRSPVKIRQDGRMIVNTFTRSYINLHNAPKGKINETQDCVFQMSSFMMVINNNNFEIEIKLSPRKYKTIVCGLRRREHLI